MTKDLFSTAEKAENLSARQKKILFRAWHRGTREADLLMGRFADAFIPQASEADQDAFEAILAENDPDIYDWVTGRLPLPANDTVLGRMIEFYKVEKL
jgi:antitoxin CptB